MKHDDLTIADTLKYSRHDFLNELQIILMNIDLGETERARAAIFNATEKIKEQSKLFALGVPKSELFLATFEWQYNVFEKNLHCKVAEPLKDVDDDELVTILQELIEQPMKQIDRFSTYTIDLIVQSEALKWQIIVKITGALPKLEHHTIKKETVQVEEQLDENLWTYTISGRVGG